LQFIGDFHAFHCLLSTPSHEISTNTIAQSALAAQLTTMTITPGFGRKMQVRA